MSPEILERTIRMASEEYEAVWFIWHGGEPLLLPLDFYKNAIKLQERYFGKDSHRVGNTIQTNGTLIDKRFMEFCKEKKINVGVSSEGPCNDVLRQRSGDVKKNLDMMNKNGYLFSVNATLCRETAGDQTGIYRYFSERRTALSFSPVILAGSATKDMIPDADTYAEASI
jgi:uncharacterized protein